MLRLRGLRRRSLIWWVRFLDEIIALLKSLPFPVFDTEATGADLSKPYLIVSGTFLRPAGESDMAEAGILDDLRIRHVAPSAAVVRRMVPRTRTLLNRKRIRTTTHVMDLVCDNTVMIAFDPDVPTPGQGNQHVKQIIDEYSVHTQRI